LASKNDPEKQPESPSPDLFSSMETRAMLQEFRELVRAGILRVTPENEVLSVKEPGAAGGSEKQAPAGSPEEKVEQLDKQLLAWLDRRRQQKEEARRTDTAPRPETAPAPDTGPAGLRLRVVERLAQKILAIWDRADSAPEAADSLRDQVAERLADEILRRWQRGLE
jgi:hypothetical protein